MVMQAQDENLAKARKKAVNAIESVINLTNYIVGGVFSKEIYSTYLPQMQRLFCDWRVTTNHALLMAFVSKASANNLCDAVLHFKGQHDSGCCFEYIILLNIIR